MPLKLEVDSNSALSRFTLPLVMAVVAIVILAVWLGVLFWLDTLNDTRSFAEWVKDDWWSVALAIASTTVGFVWALKRDKSAWDTLYADYSDVPAWEAGTKTYEGAYGFLRVDSDELEVRTFLTEAGLVIARPNGQALFFAWRRILEIQIQLDSESFADVLIERKSGLPLHLVVPWSPRLRVPAERESLLANRQKVDERRD